VNVIIRPIAIKGPTITIRKFAKERFGAEDLIRFGTLSPEMSELLGACIEAKLNIVVAGGTGSGKTTTLNILSSFIPEDQRIVTIENAAELQLRQDHVVTLESRVASVDGRGEVSMMDLIVNSLRMRPDRIIVGECRAGEALAMLQAMNTGHDGSLTTLHANTPRDTIARLETMCLMAGMDLPIRAIREQVASAVDLIVQQERLKDGTRKITYITEVLGIEGETVQLQDIFVYEQTGVDDNGKIVGRLRPTGVRPRFIEKLEQSGIFLAPGIFGTGDSAARNAPRGCVTHRRRSAAPDTQPERGRGRPARASDRRRG
jgi:pilus assembly protein CpaF